MGTNHNRRFTVAGRLLWRFAAVLFMTAAARAATPDPAPPARIGVYDSRAVAVAYAGSAAQHKVLEPLRAAQNRAKAAGDAAEVARLDAIGRAMQAKAHRQAFSTAPVDDLLEEIGEKLPAIRRAAGVVVLVSIWDEPALARMGAAARVDVTDALVDAFSPGDRQRKSAAQIRRQKPLPLDQLKDHRD